MIQNLPRHVPESVVRACRKPGYVPLRFEGAPGGPFAGDMQFRAVPNWEHSTLCRAFGLDQASVHFDVPSSVRGIGANQQGHGGGASALRQNGFVFMAGHDRPVAKISVCIEGERFADRDPTSVRDFEDLGHA